MAKYKRPPVKVTASGVLQVKPADILNSEVGQQQIFKVAGIFNKPKAYISGGMSGYSDYNYPAFYAAERTVRKLGYKPLNPVNVGDPTLSWAENMRRCLKLLMDADLVVTLPGWQASKGATTEVTLARTLGIPVIFIDLLPPVELFKTPGY